VGVVHDEGARLLGESLEQRLDDRERVLLALGSAGRARETRTRDRLVETYRKERRCDACVLEADIDPYALTMLDEFRGKDALAVAAGRLHHDDRMTVAGLTQPFAADVVRR
jgi:hypothetical protein